jgi:TonB family protein
MNAFASHPAVHITGLVLLHFIWQGAMIGVAHALLLKRLDNASPDARYNLSLVALTLLLLAPLATLLYYLPADQTGIATAVVHADSIVVGASAVVTHESLSVSPLQTWLPWLVTAWIVGVLACALRFGIGLLSLRRILRNADESLIPAWLRDELDILRSSFGIHRRVRLAVSDLIDSPLVVGWIIPTILLPVSASTGLGADQLRMALMHELAHVRRHDYLVNVIQVVLETVLFYHPAVHHVSRSLRREREQCCDDVVAAHCNNRIAYARLLAELETLRKQQPALAMSSHGSELAIRVNRIVGIPVAVPHRKFNWPFLLPLALAVTLLAISPVDRDRASGMQPIQLNLPPATAQALPEPIKALETEIVPVMNNRQAAAEESPTTTPTRTDEVSADETMAATGSGSTKAVQETQAAPATKRPARVTAPANNAVTDTSVATEPDVITSTVQGVNEIPSSATVAAEEKPIITGGKLLQMTEPDYPQYARRVGMEGQVTLRFMVTEDGSVRDVEVVSAEPERVFNSAAIEAVRQWRFSPYLENGNPVSQQRLQVLDFTLHSGTENGLQRDCDTTGTRICRSGIGNGHNVVTFDSSNRGVGR